VALDGLNGARVLVTGASGFIGSHLTRRLVSEGADVHALTSAVSAVYPLRLVDLRGSITLHEGSLADRTAMQNLARRAKPDYVFHLGAYTHVLKSWSRIDECVQTNVAGTVNLLQALAESGYRRFVSVGTSEIYGDVPVPFIETEPVNPISPYAVAKHAAERFCQIFADAYGWPIVMLRPFNAYGPAQSPDRIVPEIIVSALRGNDLLMTEGRQTREMNYVEDLIDGFILAAVTTGVEGELFNVGSGEEVSMADLARTVLGLMGDPVEARLGALPERPTEIARMRSDSSKARKVLGWEPRHTLAAGLAKTIAWYRAELERAGSPFVT
jgi:nucleoside-diphosphate-sugar epimerase